jgi:hypothetical protein
MEVFVGFSRSATSGVVVKGGTEYLAAEPFPVVPGIREVQVPGGIHIFRRTDRFGRGGSEEHVPLVLVKDPIGV